MKKTTYYTKDLAYIHDIGFTASAKSIAPAILKTLRRYGLKKGHVIDLGCGSGVWAKDLIKGGYSVLGIDISPDMIKLARQNVPKGEFIVGSYIKTKLPACNVVTSFGECFNYLFDDKNNGHELTKLFQRIWNALSSNGVLVFDIAEPGRGSGPKQKNAEGKDWSILVNIEEKNNILTRYITTFRKVNKLYSCSKETHKLQLYKASEIAKLLRKVGFKVKMIRKLDDYNYPKSMVCFIARKS